MSRKLTVRGVAAARTPGFHADGDGLFLKISPGGGKSWVVRLTLKGKRLSLGLGPVDLLGLAEARQRAVEWRRLARQGLDPRKASEAAQRTLRAAVEDFHVAHSATWAPGHAARWLNSLEREVLPTLGALEITEIGPGDILQVLRPLWTAKPDTAGRILQRIGAVYEAEMAAGRYRGLAPPTAGLRRALPRVRPTVEHRPALDWRQVPALYAGLCERQGVAAAALRFLILTACRSGEVRGARWAEIEADTWTIPASRMKARQAHTVPLSAEALAVLAAVRGLGHELIFPAPAAVRNGAQHGAQRPLSFNAFARYLPRGEDRATAHGFRTSFRTWCGDHRVDREVAELCLAHRIGSAVEQAYARGDLLRHRRAVMERWARHVTGQTSAEVVELAR